MDPRLQRRIQRYGWDRASESYERFWSRQLAPAHELLFEMAALQTGERVLDVACGTGLVSLPAARRVGKSGRVLGTDISQQMVEEARRRATDAGLVNCEFYRMEAESLSLDEDSFDVALCGLGLMYVPEPSQALSEMVRLLRPAGRVVSAVWGGRPACGWAEIFPIVDSRVSSQVCPQFFQLGTGDAQGAVFESAGLESVRTRRISVSLEYDSPESALGAAFVGGPVAMAHSRFDRQTRDEAHREYLDSIEGFSDPSGSYAIPGEFVVTSGRVPASV